LDRFLALDYLPRAGEAIGYLPRAGEAIGALAGWVQSGKIKTKVDVQDGLEDSHILEPTSLASPIQTQRSSIMHQRSALPTVAFGQSDVQRQGRREPS
jgi:hypothetical protein